MLSVIKLKMYKVELSSNDFQMRHEYLIGTQTPDWCILDEESTGKGIIELASFHIDKTTEDEMEEQLRVKPIALVWRDQNKDNVDGLYHCIWRKAPAYRSLAEELRIPYIVAIFGEFRVNIDFEEELCPCLFDEESGLFKMYPELSGVLYFRESFGRYLFNYAQNPNPLQSFTLPSNVFPSKR